MGTRRRFSHTRLLLRPSSRMQEGQSDAQTRASGLRMRLPLTVLVCDKSRGEAREQSVL